MINDLVVLIKIKEILNLDFIIKYNMWLENEAKTNF